MDIYPAQRSRQERRTLLIAVTNIQNECSCPGWKTQESVVAFDLHLVKMRRQPNCETRLVRTSSFYPQNMERQSPGNFYARSLEQLYTGELKMICLRKQTRTPRRARRATN